MLLVSTASEATPLVIQPRPVVMPSHGVVVAESRHAPRFSGELCEQHLMFHLTLAGRAVWEGGNGTHEIAPGMLVVVAPEVPHRQRDLPGSPVSLWFIHARASLLPQATAAALQEAALLPIHLDDHPSCVRQQVQAWFQELIYEQDAQQPGWEAAQLARVLDLAALTLRLAQRRQVSVPVAVGETADPAAGASRLRVAAYVRRQESHFWLRESLADAAASAQMGRRQFTALFRALTGETWNQRLLRLRVEHAERLLRDTTRSVTAVAFASGFDDISHFNHSFKRLHGCTPSTFRARHRPILQD